MKFFIDTGELTDTRQEELLADWATAGQLIIGGEVLQLRKSA